MTRARHWTTLRRSVGITLAVLLVGSSAPATGAPATKTKASFSGQTEWTGNLEGGFSETLTSRYRLSWALWTLMGEPVEDFVYQWQRPMTITLPVFIGSYQPHLDRSRLSRYPELAKRYDALRPTSVVLEGSFSVKGTWRGVVTKLIKPDLIPDASTCEWTGNSCVYEVEDNSPLHVPGSPKWSQFFVPQTAGGWSNEAIFEGATDIQLIRLRLVSEQWSMRETLSIYEDYLRASGQADAKCLRDSYAGSACVDEGSILDAVQRARKGLGREFVTRDRISGAKESEAARKMRTRAGRSTATMERTRAIIDEAAASWGDAVRSSARSRFDRNVLAAARRGDCSARISSPLTQASTAKKGCTVFTSIEVQKGVSANAQDCPICGDFEFSVQDEHRGYTRDADGNVTNPTEIVTTISYSQFTFCLTKSSSGRTPKKKDPEKERRMAEQCSNWEQTTVTRLEAEARARGATKVIIEGL